MELKMNEKATEQFKVVKENMGVNSDQSVIGLLISKEYHRIQRSKLHKVFLPKETYEKAEKAAEIRNQTLYEYVEELALDMIKKAEEGVQHAEN
jgi:SRSO17 transposase